MCRSIGQNRLIGKPIVPSGMIALGKRLTAVLVQSTMAGTESILRNGPWSSCFQSSQSVMPLRSMFWRE